MPLLLRQLFEQVIAYASSSDPEGCCLTAQHFFGKLDYFGTQNPHLVHPTRDPIAGRARVRESPLTGAEPVHGDHLLFAHCSHDPFSRLYEHDSVASIEDHLLSVSGVFNPFLTYLVPFVKGAAVRYRLVYRDTAGQVAVYDQFDLHKPDLDLTRLESRYPGRRVEWLR